MRRAVLLLAAVLALTGGASSVSAATTYRSYAGTLNGNHGTARLTIFTSGAGNISLNAEAMAQGSWSEAIYRGTCSSLSTKVATLPNAVVGSSGKIVRTNSLTAAQVAKLKGYKAVVRLKLGTRVVCAPFATVSVPPVGKTERPSNCHPSYSPCLPVVADLNCPDVRALGAAPVTVRGPDDYRLDADHDGIGCE